MADIKWPTDHGASLDMLKDHVSDLHTAIYGNGRDGILDFITQIKGAKNILLFLAIYISAIATAVGVIVAIWLAHGASANPAKVFGAEHQPQVYARQQQMSDMSGGAWPH